MHRQPGMTSPRRPSVLAAVALGLLACLVAACSSPQVVPAAGPLMTVEIRGGECVSAPCGTFVTVERDGRVHQATKPPNDLGTIPAGQLAALDAAIASTDFAAMKRHLFTGQCPTAFDGQEIIFEFGAPGGTQRISSCEVAVDYGSPLFMAVSTALGPFVPLPTT